MTGRGATGALRGPRPALVLVALAVFGASLVLPSRRADAFVEYDIPAAVAGVSSLASGAAATAGVTAAGTVVVGGLVFAGAAIGTYKALRWLDSGSDLPTPDFGPQNLWTTDIQPCVGNTASKCLGIGAEFLPNLGTGFGSFWFVSDHHPNGFPQYLVQYSAAVSWTSPSGGDYYGGTVQPSNWPVANSSAPLATSSSLNCVSTPTCGILPGEYVQIRRGGSTPAVAPLPIYGSMRVAPSVDASGLKRKLRTQVFCVGTSLSYTSVATSPEYWDRDKAQVEAPVTTCNPGYRATSITTWIQTVGGTNYVPAISDRQIFRWDSPTVAESVRPTVERCMTVGAGCVLELSPTPANPERCLWGGEVVPDSYCTDTVNLLQTQPQTSTTTTVSPSTSVVPSTTASTSTTSTSVAIAPPLPPTTVPKSGPTDPPVPPTPSTFANCLDERTDGFQGVGWNVSDWVVRLVQYIVAPIYCALVWFFVPAGGWASVVAEFQSIWNGSPVLAPLRQLANFSGSTSCFPVNLGGQFFGNVSIDVGLCDNPFIAALWTLFLAFAVIGMAQDLLATVRDFQRSKGAGAFSRG